MFNIHEHAIVEKEIHTLLEKGVIQGSLHEPGEFISPIFLRPKSDGSYRMIPNLKKFNEFVEYHHFKMDTLDTVVNVDATVSLFSELGFYLHDDKSVFKPTQQLIFLGFQLDSRTMTVSPTIQKVSKTIQACTTLKNKQSPLISDVSEVIGILVFNFPGVDYGPLYYRSLDRDKIIALKAHRGNYNSPMQLSA